MASRHLSFGLTLLLTLSAVAVRAQSQGAGDARSILQDAAVNMGANGLKTLRYTGGGMKTWLGQPFAAVSLRTGIPEHWPRLVVTTYTMTIDYETLSSQEEYITTTPAFASAYPDLDAGGGAEEGSESEPTLNRGGGGIFDLAPHHIHEMVSENFAWDVGENAPVRQWTYFDGMDAAEYRKLQIILTPHGFVKAALAPGAAPAIVSRNPSRVMITVLGKYKVIGTIQQNLVTDVESWIPNPVAGDMRITQSYRRWKDFGGIKFYTDVQARAYAGEHTDFQNENDTLQYRIANATANVPLAADTFTIPAPFRQAQRPGVVLASRKLGPSTWLIGSRPDNSILVEFRDFLAVVEASANDERSQAVIAEVKRLVPNKPIRYVVNTHNHWDHSGGLRGFVAEGAQIVTHEMNLPYYQQVMFGSEFRLQPDTLAKLEETLGKRIAPRFVAVGDEPVMISDHEWGSSSAGRIMEIYCVGDGEPPAQVHAQDMLVVYLPDEKLLINTDLFNGLQPVDDAKLPTSPAERAVALSHLQDYKGVVALDQLIRRYKLDVAWHVPIHGQPLTQERFLKILGNAAVLNSRDNIFSDSSDRSPAGQRP